MVLNIILVVIIICMSIFLYIKSKQINLNELNREVERQLKRDIIKNTEIKKNLLNEVNQYKERIDELNLQEKDLKRQITDSTQQMDKMTTSFKQVQQSTIEAQKSLQTLIDTMSETAEKEVNAKIEIMREAKIKQLDEEHQAKVIAILEEETELREKIIPIREELDKYTAQRAAIIETMKREEELKNNQNYHSISLSEESVEDLKYIQSLLNKLHNKEVIAKVAWEAYIQTPTKEMLNRVVGKEKKSGIYRITNVNSKLCYVGQGVDLSRRLAEHIKGTLGIQSIADQRVHHAMAETGLENWTFEVLEECEKEKLNEREKFWINYYKSNEFGYNKTAGNK